MNRRRIRTVPATAADARQFLAKALEYLATGDGVHLGRSSVNHWVILYQFPKNKIIMELSKIIIRIWARGIPRCYFLFQFFMG